MTFERVLACIPAILLCGCVGVLPEKTQPHGIRLTDSDVAFIEPGLTTRAELLDQLGTHCVMLSARPQLGCPARISYSWESGTSWTAWASGLKFWCGTRTETADWGGWHAFFVALDQSDIVRAGSFQTLRNDQSLHEQLDDWAIRQQTEP